ncbi:hypothetical protein [Hydrocarboniphaga sp.]|uniref:hypothetical protein n=1 Tax=Hydrocarboniphaga sp. TaxID=2033016 RepID=UPI003D13997B
MSEDSVLNIRELPAEALQHLLAPLGLGIVRVADDETIPGSYWGEREAGLVGDALYLRGDTPVHSALHEACHWLCMDTDRRRGLHTDAGGSDVEESAVCYLQGLLAPHLAGYSRERLFADMDAWGYHFRLGSTRAWFEQDSEDAQAWLRSQGRFQCWLEGAALGHVSLS